MLSIEETEKFIEEFYDQLLLAAKRIAKRDEEATEILQDACIQFVRNRDKIEPITPKCIAWFKVTMKNLAINRWRAQKRLVYFDKDFLLSNHSLMRSEEPTQLERLEEAQIARDIKKLMIGLSAQQYKVIQLWMYRDMGQVEIAELLGIPVATVGSQIFRAKKYLRRHILDRYKWMNGSLSLLDNNIAA